MGDDILTVYVKEGDGKTRTVKILPSATTDDLIREIAKLQSMEPERVEFAFGAQIIQYGSGRTIKDLNIIDRSTVMLVYGLLGGVWPTEALKSKKCNLQPLPGYITITSSEEDADMITLDNDPNEKRAKMPCGHVIGPASMTSYCHSILSQGLAQFNCPLCSREWEYFLVRHVACLSEQEMRKIEEKLEENHLAKSQGIIQCPGCRNYCFRENKDTVRMRCLICARTNRRKPDFCWYCLKDWKGGSNNKCGNSDCGGVDKRIQILATCPTKKIKTVEVPSLRGCPKCGYLIEHRDACKHMTCRCKYEFCFACLKPRKDGKWECSAYLNECGVAPRQTTLPGC